jgi:CarboxypepD_reg-like domain/Domain of unknown function (DUF5666)
MCKAFVSVCVPLSIVVALAGAACGKGSTPASPSSSATGAAPQPAAAATGATIAGTVVSSAGAQSVRSMGGATINVSIVGTNISATIDASGTFTLQNVPSGDVTLAFSGNGIDARLTISGVSNHEQIRITVNLQGTTADADETERESEDHRAEIEGKISSITLSTRTFVVGRNMTMLVVPPGTPIHHGSTAIDFSKLAAGERIHAHATKSGTTFTATDVEVQNEHTDLPDPGDDHGHDGDDNEAEAKGTVSGAATGHACPAFTFSIGSTTVTTNASTKFEDVSCAGVVNGISVEVKGTRTSVTAITATTVEKK